MTTLVEAIYEDGTLRLLAPIPLAEGSHVQILVIPPALPSAEQTPAAILAAIAALPLGGDGNAFVGRDHDALLYGERGSQ